MTISFFFFNPGAWELSPKDIDSMFNNYYFDRTLESSVTAALFFSRGRGSKGLAHWHCSLVSYLPDCATALFILVCRALGLVLGSAVASL